MDNNTCEGCQAGFILSSNNSTCGLLLHAFGLTECSYIFLSTERECFVTNCSSCVTDQNTCDACNDGYYLMHDDCCKFSFMKIRVVFLHQRLNERLLMFCGKQLNMECQGGYILSLEIAFRD